MMGFSWPNWVRLIHCKYSVHALKLKFVKILSPILLVASVYLSIPASPTQQHWPNQYHVFIQPTAVSGSVQETYLKTIFYHQTKQHFVGQCLWVKSVCGTFSPSCKTPDFDKLIHNWFSTCFACVEKRICCFSTHKHIYNAFCLSTSLFQYQGQ